MHDLAKLNRLNCKVNAAEAEFNRINEIHCKQTTVETTDRLSEAWTFLLEEIKIRNKYRLKMLEHYDLVEYVEHV